MQRKSVQKNQSSLRSIGKAFESVSSNNVLVFSFGPQCGKNESKMNFSYFYFTGGTFKKKRDLGFPPGQLNAMPHRTSQEKVFDWFSRTSKALGPFVAK